ncbi:MAG: glycogen synthase [Chloroflexi bacterium]|nr:glycogen synthase [Chloroflexota bacterium]
MRVLFLAAEATPLVKVGGLADVAGELPRALARHGVDVQLALPFYPGLQAELAGLRPLATVEVPRPDGAQTATIYALEVDGRRVWLIGGEPIDAAPAVYGAPEQDAAKFVFFGIGALQACRALGWEPEVVHAHDWHAAPSLAWMRTASLGWDRTSALLTVHNLPYMGAGGDAALAEYGLRPAEDPHLPDWARRLPLPLGMAHADWITTVSPSYAAEIQTPAFGCGLEAFLASRGGRLRGILNGIDPGVWNPGADAALERRYAIDSLECRLTNKTALQHIFGWPEHGRTPLLAMITRLDVQKGVDLVLDALAALQDVRWQFILLGRGDPAVEAQAEAFAAAHGDRAAFIPQFDPFLSRRIYAGADMLLAPSRYEPCGLAQLIGLRYGAVPVVRATGGLRDTVQPYGREAQGTGFLFDRPDPQALAETLRFAIQVHADARRWAGVQRRGMAADFSWAASAAEYSDLYLQAAAERRARSGV